VCFPKSIERTSIGTLPQSHHKHYASLTPRSKPGGILRSGKSKSHSFSRNRVLAGSDGWETVFVRYSGRLALEHVPISS